MMRLSSSFFAPGTHGCIDVGYLGTLLKKKLTPKLIKIISQGCCVTGVSLLCWLDILPAWSEPNEIVIDEIKVEDLKTTDNPRVQSHPGQEECPDSKDLRCWRNLTLTELPEKTWLATGRDAETEYITKITYVEGDLEYRQQSDTFVQFYPKQSGKVEEQCGFKIQSGKALIGKSQDSTKKECLGTIDGSFTVTFSYIPPELQQNKSNSKSDKDTGETELENSVVVVHVFRNRDDRETIIGVLANQQGSIEVKHFEGNTEILEPGDYVFVSDDGDIRKGQFSVEYFYQNNPLGLGLGNQPRDDEYVEEIEDEEEQEFFKKIRVATVDFLGKQPKPSPFELKTSNSPSFRAFQTIIGIDTLPLIDSRGESPSESGTGGTGGGGSGGASAGQGGDNRLL